MVRGCTSFIVNYLQLRGAGGGEGLKTTESPSSAGQSPKSRCRRSYAFSKGRRETHKFPGKLHCGGWTWQTAVDIS